ncbi:dihydrolipoamide acetyltransferase family protein [Segetibacter aerophilus]|uniref:Dihydrolipoamide acetyltransferase component of pyruvate dehydrogenase complex n=1 Tax=Segetibacter aerophilus TaxID=670293 RepID=A0A512BGB3_9BACT|nr:dihydrolipoamide acetyltransferase family protein [Segetibacter aerophilus]GEO11006.1 dihydrolipoamide acetyltransferase component of pyruvate dehydrogenase complex [Segetibacter aerophilus]
MAIVDLVMPKLGESIMEATVLKWTKKVGETVKMDETLLEIATDKVDSEVPSTSEGVLTEILFNENEVVPIGTVIARIETTGNATDTAEMLEANSEIEVIAETNEPLEPFTHEHAVEREDDDTFEEPVPFLPHLTTNTSSSGQGNNKFYSPLVLNIANSEGIAMTELENIPGTGNEGRVTKKDILQYVAAKKDGKPSQPIAPIKPVDEPKSEPAKKQSDEMPVEEIAQSFSAPTGNVEIIEMDRMRKMIAKHMVNSKQTSPHVTSFSEADVTNMVMWRERVKKQFEKQEGVKLTFTPMFIACVTKVIKRYPYINCSVEGDRIILKKDINIGMATALPSGNLIVPVIRNADHLNLVGLSKSVNSLADAARTNRLKPDDTNAGTFTITNVGTFGSLMGTPIINQPQVAILAVGAIKKRPMVIETSEGDAIGIRHMMYLSLSYDHRVVDGSVGASFLTEVAKEFENWDVAREW